MSVYKYLAFDLGASSGRGIIGTLEDGKITLKELNRFYNGMTYVNGSYFWDIYRLYDEIKKGLLEAANQKEIPDSIGIDTWGVDYGLLDEKGNLLANPYAYRDHRTDTAIEEFFKIFPKEKIYDLTGIQFMQFNTLFQLYAAQRDKLPIMNIAKDLLFIPDLLNYFLSGVKKSEFSFATTSQLFNPVTQNWEKELFNALDIPVSLMQEIVDSGSVIGQISSEVARESQLPETDLVAVASHDTGSAIAAIPADNENFAYISSGTWSLMGIETNKPIINDKALSYNFTNEGGVGRTIRFLKNIMGLWLIQECRKNWAAQKKEYSFPDLVKMADLATPFRSFIDPDDMSFYNPTDMTQSIQEFCKRKNQSIPETPGQFARVIFEGLALKYRYTLDCIREVSDKKIDTLHIIGGGSQNELLCQFAANATGLRVVAGPAEGTALGNLMVQGLAKGHIKNLQEIRSIIKNSFTFKEYLPKDTDKWNNAYDVFKTKIIN